MSRAILIPAILLLGNLGVSVTPAKSADGEKATYLGGSVTSIPRYKEVMFDFSNAHNLSLKAEKSSVEIPYDKISKMEMGRSGWRGKRVKNVPIWFSKDSPAITIHFKSNEDVDQIMVLALSHQDTMTAVPVLESRTGKEVAHANLRKPEDGTWWGDRYWRTDRNAGTWAKGPQPTVAESTSNGANTASATTTR